MNNIYQPRVEITSKRETRDAWQDYGQFSSEEEAMEVAKELKEKIAAGRYEDRITDEDKKNGYFLNACVEVLDADTFSLLEILEVA